jgi:DNA-binding NtrC family response regulator
LSVFPVQVPPLRKRGDDVIQLAVHFLEQVCREFGRPCPSFTQAQVDAMRRYSWPGNIRELKNVIERAVILSTGDSLRLDLPEATGMAGLPAPVSVAAGPAERNFYTEQELRIQERENTRRALEFAGWRVSGAGGAAELLGVKPSTLADRIRSMGLARPTAQNSAT